LPPFISPLPCESPLTEHAQAIILYTPTEPKQKKQISVQPEAESLYQNVST